MTIQFYSVTKADQLFATKGEIPSVDATVTQGSANAVSGGAVYAALDGKESTSNRVTSLSPSSTDVQYPSAKAVYDAVQSAGKVQSVNGSTGDVTVSKVFNSDGDKFIDGDCAVYHDEIVSTGNYFMKNGTVKYSYNRTSGGYYYYRSDGNVEVYFRSDTGTLQADSYSTDASKIGLNPLNGDDLGTFYVRNDSYVFTKLEQTVVRTKEATILTTASQTLTDAEKSTILSNLGLAAANGTEF